MEDLLPRSSPRVGGDAGADPAHAAVSLLLGAFGFHIVEVWRVTTNVPELVSTHGDDKGDLTSTKAFREEIGRSLCRKADKEVVWENYATSSSPFRTHAAVKIEATCIVAYAIDAKRFDPSRSDLLNFLARAVYDASSSLIHGGSPAVSAVLPARTGTAAERATEVDDEDLDRSIHWASFAPAAGSDSDGTARPKAPPQIQAQLPALNLNRLLVSSSSASRPTSASSQTSAATGRSLGPTIALSARKFQTQLTARTRRSDFEIGMDIEVFDGVKLRFAGPNSQVFDATHRGRHVVLKVMHIDRMDDPVILDEFSFEAEMLSRMAHPNICLALGCGGDPLPFLVLEQLQPLSQFLNLKGAPAKQAPWPFTRVLEMARDLASGLHYLHELMFDDAMVIHRDIKPENVGLDETGRLKLFDFGLGRCVKKRSSLNEMYMMTGETGSLRYMAPEIAMNKPYTEKVDVYSFAVTMWSTAANATAFPEFTKPAPFRERVVLGGLRPPIDPAWPADFRTLLEACWQADSQRRPSCQKASAALQRMLAAGVSTHTAPTSPAPAPTTAPTPAVLAVGPVPADRPSPTHTASPTSPGSSFLPALPARAHSTFSEKSPTSQRSGGGGGTATSASAKEAPRASFSIGGLPACTTTSSSQASSRPGSRPGSRPSSRPPSPLLVLAALTIKSEKETSRPGSRSSSRPPSPLLALAALTLKSEE